jgi:hypothetical protein
MSAVLSRFQKFVAPQPSGCWHWMGAKNAKGYGRFYLDGNKHVHRVSYELRKGHEYTPENTYVERTANGRSKRHCKVCMANRKGEQS